MTEIKTRKSDKWIPWYFVGFFIILAILDGIFVTIATSTHRGVITEKAYQKGLDYNEVVTASEEQDKLELLSKIDLLGNDINFALYNRNNKLINNAKVTAYFTRITQDGYDFSVKLKNNNEGTYSHNVNFPLKGLWDVRILATWDQKQYQISKKIIAK